MIRDELPLYVAAAGLASLLILNIAAPFIQSAGTVLGLDGTVGIVDHRQLWSSMDPVSGIMYTLGDFFCHQDEARTLILNGNEMPICMRDAALMTSLAAGLVLAAGFWNFSSRMDNRMILVCAILVALTPIEWALEGALDVDSLALRVVVSVPTGIGGAFLVARLLGMELGRPNGM